MARLLFATFPVLYTASFDGTNNSPYHYLRHRNTALQFVGVGASLQTMNVEIGGRGHRIRVAASKDHWDMVVHKIVRVGHR